MRIIIDMQGAQSDSRFRGIGRYTLSFVEALIKQGKNHDFYLILNDKLPQSVIKIRNQFCGLVPSSNILVWHQPELEGVRTTKTYHRRRVSELVREALILSLSPDLVHITSFFEGYVDASVMSIDWLLEHKILVSSSLYDLIPLLNPHQYLEPDSNYKNYYYSLLDKFKKVDLMLGISEYACTSAKENLSVNSTNIVNVSAAVDSQFISLKENMLDKKVFSKYAIAEKFILYVSGADPQKNLATLIQAYLSLGQVFCSAFQLVVVAPNIDENHVGMSKESSIINNIRLLGHVDDQELIELYQLCSLFVFPSLSEGFGFPVLEALSCGVAVIASNSSSLSDVISFEEALFDPKSVQSIANKISQVLTDDKFKSKLIENARYQSILFSWDEVGKKAIDAMVNLVNSKKETCLIGEESVYSELIKRISAIPKIYDNLSSDDLIHLSKSIADTFPYKPKSPRIFIDISILVKLDHKTGIQRVTRSILNEFLFSPPRGYLIEPIYASIHEMGYRFARKYIKQFFEINIQTDEDEIIDPQQGDIFLGLDLAHHVTLVQEEFFQHMQRQGVFVCWVVYDLLPIHFPQYWPTENRVTQFHEDWLRIICQGNGVLCISNSVAIELIEWKNKYCPQNNDLKVSWFHLGADIKNSLPTIGLPDEASSIFKVLSQRLTFSLVGTIEPRKGYMQVLDAFHILWNEGININLVIVGKQGWLAEDVVSKIKKSSEIGQRLFWISNASDEYLDDIYRLSTCMIQASVGEGFGLPLIEAAKHGVPIIARDLPVFKEIAKSNAYYFTGTTGVDLAIAIKEWIHLNEIGNIPLSSKIKWMTWSESAQMLWDRIQMMKCNDASDFKHSVKQ